MDDMISRQEAIEAINKRLQDPADFGNREYRAGLYECVHIIKSLPSAEKTGEWLIKYPKMSLSDQKFYQLKDIDPEREDKRFPRYVCSCCGKSPSALDKRYCQHCGARMVREED